MRHLDIRPEKHHDVCVRTTLTVDDDLAERLAQQARETGHPFKVVVNEALRRGLAVPSSDPFTYQAHAGHLKAGIDPRGFNELASQLDDEGLEAERNTHRR
jgi:hypothetical protein